MALDVEIVINRSFPTILLFWYQMNYRLRCRRQTAIDKCARANTTYIKNPLRSTTRETMEIIR